MKFSKYNVFYEHGDNFLLMNTMTDALLDKDRTLQDGASHSQTQRTGSLIRTHIP